MVERNENKVTEAAIGVKGDAAPLISQTKSDAAYFRWPRR
jgi:hypothetical protein